MLNESVNDIFKNLNIPYKNSSDISSSGFSIKKKNKPISTLDNLEFNQESNLQTNADIVPLITDELTIPKSMEETFIEIKTEEVKSKKLSRNAVKKEPTKLIELQQQKISISQNLQQTIESNQTIEELEETVVEELRNELTEEYESNTGNEVPENVDIVEVAEEISEAIENIPDAKNLSIDDFTITENSKVPGKRFGYTKGVVKINSLVGSNELSEIKTIVKKQTDGMVGARAMSPTTISNINKYYKGAKHKLFSISYVFKPDPKRLKVNAGTQLVLSLSLEEYESKKTVLIYIQQSRDKFIVEVPMDIQFIAKLISQYYVQGFEATKAFLKSNGSKNPLNLLVNKFMMTGKYLVKPLYKKELNEEGQLINDSNYDMVVFKHKHTNHQWLKVVVKKLNLPDSYAVVVKSDLDKKFNAKIEHKSGTITMEYLLSDSFMNNIENLFMKYDWAQHDMGIDSEENRHFYLYKKLTYKPLKSAFDYILQYAEDNPESNVIIKETLSQLDTKKDDTSGYQAEIIIGKTSFIDYYMLSWLSARIDEGDRNGRVTKQNRKYHARKNMFQIAYSINGKVYSKLCNDFETVLNETQFLSEFPII